MKLLDSDTRHSNNNRFSSDSDDEERNKPDDINILALLNKIMESIEDLCDMYIESKYIKS